MPTRPASMPTFHVASKTDWGSWTRISTTKGRSPNDAFVVGAVRSIEGPLVVPVDRIVGIS